MNQSFKFKYMNQLAGAFVVLAVILLVGGAVVSGVLQGWFEGTFEVNARFDAGEKFSIDEGSFGLKDGSEVVIFDTPAGMVKAVSPDENGLMTAVLKIKNRYRPFVTKGSVGRVKKKLQFTGDSYIQVSAVKGEPLKDNDVLIVKKDEEIIEKVNKALEEVQKVAVPMLNDLQHLLENANIVVSNVACSKGLAGALVSDPDIALHAKDVIAKSSDLMSTANDAVREINSAVGDARKAIDESTRLIKGAQNHWLLRKYVPKGASDVIYIPISGSDELMIGRLNEKGGRALEKAYISGDSNLLAVTAFVMAASLSEDLGRNALVSAVKYSGAEKVLADSLLTALGCRDVSSAGEARKSFDSLMKAKSKEYGGDVKLQCVLYALTSFADKQFAAELADCVVKAGKLCDGSEAAHLKAYGCFLSASYSRKAGRRDAALQDLQKAEELLKGCYEYVEMALVSETRGDIYKEDNRIRESAMCYRSSGMSLYHAGAYASARRVLGKALKSAEEFDASLAGDISVVLSTIHENSAKAGKPLDK